MSDRGEIVAVGTPEQVSENPGSYTGQYLKQVLARHPIASAVR